METKIEKTRFIRHEKTDSNEFIDVSIHLDSPAKEITTYKTLSDQRANFIAVDREDFGAMDSVIANLSFSFDDHQQLYVGDVITDVLNYYTDSEMKHLLLMPPFLWGDELENQKDLYLIVPISESEYQFSEQFGVDKLIELLNIYDIDVADIYRKSVEIPQLF